MVVDLYTQKKEKIGEVELSSKVFELPRKDVLVWEAIVSENANLRQGTRSTKTRGEVRGGGRKPWKQKGTGRARAGTIRSPIWRSGGVTFAHVFRPSKKKKVNRKMYRAAFRSIISRLINEERLVVIDSLEINEPPKTSELKNLLSKLGFSNAVFVFKEKK
jgi:large subunit ribosomal protein L4